MSRRVIMAAAVIVGFGALVAYVRAQDTATRSVLRSINDSSLEPTLASPPTSTRRIQESTEGTGSTESSGNSRYSNDDADDAVRAPTTGRRMSLADRLKQARESASKWDRRSPGSSQVGAAVTGSVTANPATSGPLNRETVDRESGPRAPVVGPTRVADERGAISSQPNGSDDPNNRYSARRIPRAPVPSASGPQQPNVQQPNVQQPNVQQPNVQQPNVQQPNVQQPNVQQPNVQQPNVQQPNVQQPNVQQPNVQQPSVRQPSVQQLNAEQSPSDFADEAPAYKEPAYQQPQTILEQPQAEVTRPQTPVRSTASSLLSSVGPQIRVETIGPRSVMVGKPAEYNITVTNAGKVVAQEIYVRVSLPSWVEVQADNATSGATQLQAEGAGQQKLVWTIDQIEPHSQTSLKLFARPNTNRPFDLMVDWTLRPISSVAQIEVQQPRLEMAVFGPKNVLYGDSAVYTIQLTNPGTGNAENVALEFSYGARRLEKKVIGDIAAGEQNEVNVELTAQQAGQLRVAAVATADGGLKAEANEDILVRRGELEVGVIGSSLKFAGGVGTYKVRVKNVGNATANGVTASIVLPPGAKVVGAQDDESGSILQDIGALLPGAERTIGIQCQLMMPGENRIDAVVKSGGGLEKSASFTTRVEALADLKLTVSDPRGPTPLGVDAIYEVHIVNRGTKAAERIKIVAQFSEGVEPVEANGGAADIVPGQVLFHPISRIEPGDELVLKIVAKADKVGNHRFRAELAAGDPETRLIAEETTYFFGEDTARTATRPSTEEATQ